MPRTPTALPADEPVVMDGWVQLLIQGLVALREQRRWTQGELGERSGLHRETIGRLERLRPTANRPSALTLTALASAFGYVHLSDLWSALQGAATATVPPTGLHLGTADVSQLVLAYLDCTPAQQQYLRGLASIYAARRRCHSARQGELLDLTNIPYQESYADVAEPARSASRPRRTSSDKENDHDHA